MAVTKDHVFHAADHLTEIGIDPTNQAVRDQLGSGSFKTIQPFLKEWRELKKQAADVPAELASSMEHTLLQVWAAAKETAKLAFVGEKNTLNAKLSEAEDTLRLRDEEIEGLNNKIASLTKTIEDKGSTAETAKAEAKERISELKTELSEARSDAKEAQKSERDLNKQLVALTKEVAEAKAAAEKAKAEATEANAKLAETTKPKT